MGSEYPWRSFLSPCAVLIDRRCHLAECNAAVPGLPGIADLQSAPCWAVPERDDWIDRRRCQAECNSAIPGMTAPGIADLQSVPRRFVPRLHAVRLRKDRGFPFAVGTEDRADLVRVDHITVELLGAVGLVLVLYLPSSQAREPFPPLHHFNLALA